MKITSKSEQYSILMLNDTAEASGLVASDTALAWHLQGFDFKSQHWRKKKREREKRLYEEKQLLATYAKKIRLDQNESTD